MKKFTILTIALLAVGCASESKDYGAIAHCQSMGLNPGTAEYDKCVSEQKTKRLMLEQRREYEQMKQYDRDWKMRGY